MGQTLAPASPPSLHGHGRLEHRLRAPCAIRIPRHLWYSLSTFYYGDLHLDMGIPHGYGTILWSNGERFYGLFDYGDIVGAGTYTDVHGQQFEQIAPTWLLMQSDAVIA